MATSPEDERFWLTFFGRVFRFCYVCPFLPLQIDCKKSSIVMNELVLGDGEIKYV
jgi:hypothetical protein